MCRLSPAWLLLASCSFVVSSFAQSKRPVAIPVEAKNAMEAFANRVHENDMAFRAKAGKLIENHLKKLGETSGEKASNDSMRLTGGKDFFNAQLDQLPRGNADKIKSALDGSVWSWKQHFLELNLDGSVTTSWTKTRKSGHWYVDPDGRVIWYCSDIPVIHLMEMNGDRTEYQIKYPSGSLGVSGKKIK